MTYGAAGLPQRLEALEAWRLEQLRRLGLEAVPPGKVLGLDGKLYPARRDA